MSGEIACQRQDIGIGVSQCGKLQVVRVDPAIVNRSHRDRSCFCYKSLLRGYRPQLTLNEIGLFIGTTALSLDRINPAYRGLLGMGKIDILASLQELAAGATPPPEQNVFADCDP